MPFISGMRNEILFPIRVKIYIKRPGLKILLSSPVSFQNVFDHLS